MSHKVTATSEKLTRLTNDLVRAFINIRTKCATEKQKEFIFADLNTFTKSVLGLARVEKQLTPKIKTYLNNPLFKNIELTCSTDAYFEVFSVKFLELHDEILKFFKEKNLDYSNIRVLDRTTLASIGIIHECKQTCTNYTTKCNVVDNSYARAHLRRREQ